MITRDDIVNIAKLAKLHVDQSELDDLTSDMKKIIQFADEIGQAQADIPQENEIQKDNDRLREDSIIQSFPQDLILKNVNGGKDGFFWVKKTNKN